MKSFFLALLLVCVCARPAGAQLKSQDEQPVSAAQSLVHPAPTIGSFLGLINPDNFSMRHNFSFSYLSAGGAGVSLASYTNSMFYRIADPLNLRFDLTLQGSPFGDRSAFGGGSLSKLYLSRAELNYRPAENMFVKLQFSQSPWNYYNGFDTPYSLSDPWGDR